MASAYNRGTERNPIWWVRYKAAGGKWTSIRAPKKADTIVAARRFADEVQQRVDAGLPPVDEAGDAPEPGMVTCGSLMTTWEATLRTRSIADDKSRLHRHLLPKWKDTPIARVDLAGCMTWIDDMRAGKAPVAAPEDKPRRGRKPAGAVLSDATIRHNLNLLSRFFSWAVERGHAAVNPVRLIPTGKRPHQTGKIADAPWLDDDAMVRTVIGELPRVVGLCFYLCNRAGLRSGEALGLRLSDFGFLPDGVIRVRYSYDGPLKEDKRREGKVKRVPAPDDCAAVMAPWLAERKAKGAQPEDLVFPSEPSRGHRKQPAAVEAAPPAPAQPYRALYLSRNWNEVAARHGLRMTWYQATRHSMVSRNLSRGASLDEVADAVGHSSPTVTARHYAHFVRKSYSPTLRAGLALRPTGEPAPIINLATAKAAAR